MARRNHCLLNLAVALVVLLCFGVGSGAWANVVLSATSGAVAPTFLTTFTMQNDSGSTLPAGTPVSFGQSFRYGDVMPGTRPVIRDAATHIPLPGQQWDEISTWIENGGNHSWRHAVWGAWLPTSLAAGATYQVEFVDTPGAYSEASHQALSVLCSGPAAHNLKIHLTDVRNTNGIVRDSGDATFQVCNNISNVGRDAPRHFRAGNVYDEYQVSGLFVYTSSNKDPQLYAQCDIDIFTKASDGISPGDVRWVCSVHNSFENVTPGSAGNAGAPGPVGFANDPQTIAYVAEVDDGASDILDWRGLNSTISSSGGVAGGPVVNAAANGCGSDGGTYCMIVSNSVGPNAWYFGQAVRATCSGGCIGGLTNDQVYFVWPSSSATQSGADTTKIALCSEPTCDGNGPNGGSGTFPLNGTQGSGSTTFTTLIMHYHWNAWQTLDTSGLENWSPAGTTTRQTRKIYPAFTGAEKRYWESSGTITPINLAQAPHEFAYGWGQGESGNYNPNGRLNVIGGAGTGDRPDLGNPSEWAAEAWLTGLQLDWDAARLFTLGIPWHGFSTVINEATGRIPALNNGPPTGPGGNGNGVAYSGLGPLQVHTSWSPGVLTGMAVFNTGGPYPWGGLFTFGTTPDHQPGFDGFTYMVFGDRMFLDLMQWQANRDYLALTEGPGPLLGQGNRRDNNAQFTDGNVYHYYGLTTSCCQGRGSSWVIRDISTAAAFGQDQTATYPDGTANSERAVFDDIISETSNYWPLLLKFHDGAGNSNFSTSVWPPFNAADNAFNSVFMQGYAASVAYSTEALLHTPAAVTWNGGIQRFVEGTYGGQLPGMAAATPGGLPSYYMATYALSNAIHDGNGTWGQFGENIGQYTNGTDATDVGWWGIDTVNLLTGGQWSGNVPSLLANGDMVKAITPWDYPKGINLDQFSGTTWYQVMNVNAGVSPVTFYIQCPPSHAVDATCPTPGQPFTGYTRGGVSVSSESNTDSFKYRFHFDPGPGQGYMSGTYAQYGGLMMNELAITGFSVPNALADFTSRCGAGASQAFCYNISNPSSWYDTTIVVPGLPLAVNGLSPSGTATISSIAVAPTSFTAQSGNAGSVVGALSASVTRGSFAGSFALATSGACTGPNNASFAVAGSNLDIGGSDVTTAGTYTLCVSATDPAYTNSPFFQTITVTGVTPSAFLVNGSGGPITLPGGGTITASISGGAGNPRDWLGVFAVGAPSNSGTLGSWEYLACDCQTPPSSGVTSGTVHLVVPSAPGQYEVRYFLNDNFTVVRTSATITVPGGVQVLVNGSSTPQTLTVGATFTAGISGGPGNPGDWLGVFAVGAPSGSTKPASWAYLACNCQTIPGSGATSGTVNLVLPGVAGQYEVRFFLNDNFVVNSTSATITSSSTCGNPQVVTDKSVYASGETITVNTSCGAGNVKDWVTVYTTGSEIGPQTGAYFAYLGVTTPSATVTVQAPKATTDRDLPYEIVWYANDSFQRVQTSAPFTVTKSISPAAPTASLPSGLAADPFVPAHIITVCPSGCDQTSLGAATDQAFNAGWDNVEIKITCGDYVYPPLPIKSQYPPHVWVKGICADGVSRPHLFGKTSASSQIIRNSVFYGTGTASLTLDNLELGPWNDWLTSPIDGATWTLRNDYIRDASQGLISGNSTDFTLNIYNSVFSRNGYSVGPEHNVYVGEGNLHNIVNVVNSVFDQPQYGHSMKERAKNYNATCSIFAVNEDDFYEGSEATDIDSGQPNITKSLFVSGNGAPRSWTDNNTWDSIRYGADAETGSNPPLLGQLPAAPAINNNLFVDDVPGAGHWFVTLGLRLLNPDGSAHPVTWSNNRFVWPDAGSRQPDVGGSGVADATGALDSLGPPHVANTNDVTLDGTNQYFTGGRPSAGLTPVGTYPKGWRDYLSLMPAACTDPVGLVTVPTN